VSGKPRLKDRVRDFWDAGACGEAYADGDSRREELDAQARARYAFEPFIRDFARFAEGAGRDVLEIGVGMGADHMEWARAQPRTLAGLDLTPRALGITRERFELNGLTPRLTQGDAENLPFADRSFDIVYSWGVLHHTPDTATAVREVHRVLRPGGTVRVMIYHSHSIVGALLWARYALLAARPRRSLAHVYAEHLESPGTKAYTREAALELFRDFSSARIRVELSVGDLLIGAAGQRHRSLLLGAARRVWPRSVIRQRFHGYGLFLLIEATR
jgi:SAM-dependent methyltransferase